MEDGSLPPQSMKGYVVPPNTSIENLFEQAFEFKFGQEETFPVKGPHGTEIGRGRIVPPVSGALGIVIEVELNDDIKLGGFYRETILDMSMSLHSRVHNAGGLPNETTKE